MLAGVGVDAVQQLAAHEYALERVSQPEACVQFDAVLGNERVEHALVAECGLHQECAAEILERLVVFGRRVVNARRAAYDALAFASLFCIFLL